MKQKFNPALRASLASLALTLASVSALAGEGHDHGAAPATAEATASPRVQAHSDLFELVGLVDKGQMTVFLDRYATNEPVAGAKIEFESGTNKGVAVPQPDGTYLIKFAALSQPGDLPLSFTVVAGSDTDLLAGELRIENPAARAGDSHSHSRSKLWITGGAALGAALIAAIFLARRKSRRQFA